MSVGGTVVETIVVTAHGKKPTTVWIDTREKPHYLSTTAIYVEDSPEARCVDVGDTVWWQGNVAYWTPKDKRGEPIERADKKLNVANVPLKRRGFSGVSRPVLHST